MHRAVSLKHCQCFPQKQKGDVGHLLLMISVASLAASVLINQSNVPGCWDLINCTVKLLQLPRCDLRPGPLSTARQFLGMVQESACTGDHFQIICCMQPRACRVRQFNMVMVWDMPVVYRSQDHSVCLNCQSRYSRRVSSLACQPSYAFHFFALLSDSYVWFRLVLFI